VGNCTLEFYRIAVWPLYEEGSIAEQCLAFPQSNEFQSVDLAMERSCVQTEEAYSELGSSPRRDAFALRGIRTTEYRYRMATSA
jgi:hypothetical protein